MARHKRNPLSSVQGRDWIQESYETGDPAIRRRVAELKKLGYRAKAFSMGNQVTQWGNVKLTMVDIRAGSSGDNYLTNVPSAKNSRNRMATKKKKKKAKRNTTKKRSTAKNKKQTRSKTKKRSTGRSKSNPGAKLRSKIAQMKPGSWYPTTLSGARVKVQRKGNSLVIRPATKKRSR